MAQFSDFHTGWSIFWFEFWPFWVFYSPMIPIWLWFSFRSRHLFYFCNVNPGIEYGGFFQYSKYKLLKQLNPRWVPKTMFVKNNTEIEKNVKNLSLPIIVKPDIGERGKGIELFHKKSDLIQFLDQKSIPYLLQEFIPYPIELGIFYHRMPGEKKGTITSITSKEFLTVQGNGKDTLEKLIRNHPRVTKRLDYLLNKFEKRLNSIPDASESILLEEIGNHCRGATFLNANHLNSESITDIFDEIAGEIKEFYFGRFDLKVSSIENLEEGKNIQIMEVNGANSEVAHIYHPNYSLFKAYKEVVQHLAIQFKIAQKNKQRGFRPPSHCAFIKALISFWIGKS